MEISKFIEFFAELFDETDVNVFTKETEFKKLEEWSSLMALSVIAMVDEEYGITIQGEDIRNANTIADLFDNVKAKRKWRCYIIRFRFPVKLFWLQGRRPVSGELLR